MKDLGWVPEGVDITKPSIARIYDYFLGGTHNLSVDREAAHAMWAMMPPTAKKYAWVNRAWLQRAVRYCLAEGVTQFLDLGSGLPGRGNVHEVAQGVRPAARVVYVDVDPVAFAHAEKMLEGNDRVGAVHADLRDVERVLNDPVTTKLLNFDQPVALLMSAVLHFIPHSDDPARVIGCYADRLSRGSFLALTHGNTEHSQWREGEGIYKRTVSDVVSRSRTEVEALFDGFELIEPGVAWVEDWPFEPDTALVDPPTKLNYVGIGRKP